MLLGIDFRGATECYQNLDRLEIGHVEFKHTQLNTGPQDQLERSSSRQTWKCVTYGQLAMHGERDPKFNGSLFEAQASSSGCSASMEITALALGSEPEGSGAATVAPEGHAIAPSDHQRLLQTDSERLSL